MLLALKEYRFCCKNDRAECISNINIIDKVIEIMKSHSDQFYISKNIYITKEELCEKLNAAKDENATFEMLNGLLLLIFSLGKISCTIGGNFEYGEILLCMCMNRDKEIWSIQLEVNFNGLAFIILNLHYDLLLKEYIK